jgi:hypothetical protein
MRKSLTVIVLVIITGISVHSQGTLQTHYRAQDSTLEIRTSLFNVFVPVKVDFNNVHGVLISESHMDSINLAYLRFKVVASKYDAIVIELEKARKENEKLMVSVDFLTKDNSNLKLINTTLTEQFDIKEKQHRTEIELWKAKAKKRLTSFLIGTGVGAIIALLLGL